MIGTYKIGKFKDFEHCKRFIKERGNTLGWAKEAVSLNQVLSNSML